MKIVIDQQPRMSTYASVQMMGSGVAIAIGHLENE